MSLGKNGDTIENGYSDNQWKSIYILGGVTTIIVILGSIMDVVIGMSVSGNLMTIPQTAVERFDQLQSNRMLGLYNLDMLNLFTTILMIPTYFALCVVHRKSNIGYALLAAVIYLIGAAVFITNNAALPMLELAVKYAVSTSEAQKTLIAAAGEALLSKGAHGSPGVFPGFAILSIGSIVMAFGMLKGKVFGKPTAFIGILGSILLLIYLVLVTFVPGVKSLAMGVSAPGGLMAIAWMIMYDIKLFKLGFSK